MPPLPAEVKPEVDFPQERRVLSNIGSNLHGSHSKSLVECWEDNAKILGAQAS